MPTAHHLLIAFVAVVALGVFASAAELPDVDKLPSIPQLPDPFLFNDGSRVKSPADWHRRRAEILELVQKYEYGYLPPAPRAGEVRVTEDASYEAPKASGSNAKNAVEAMPKYPPGTVEKSYVLSIGPEGKTVSTHLIVTVPPGKGPFPAIVRGDLCWGRVHADIAEEVAKRGYILAQFDRTQLAADNKQTRDSGIFKLHPELETSAVSVWAWGYHRTIDYLLSRGDVDPKHIVITGHSRGGKTALLAGATDERIAITNPNDSGCGGAGCYREQAEKSEDIAAITKNFPYWFAPGFDRFIGHIDRLPIDQHEVKALCAPRALLSTEALGDLWANPKGTQISHLAAKEVYDFLGAGDRLAIHYREGGHEQMLDDWKTLLDFADMQFTGKTSDRGFNKLEFAVERPYDWRRPGAAK
jgi:dienelactone hydrolase